jgi:hypothetical protein
MSAPSPLVQFLRDLRREKLNADTSITEDPKVEIFNDNPRVHRCKQFSFRKADKASQRWGEESHSDMPGLPRNSLNDLVLRKSGDGHSSAATTNKDTLLSKGESRILVHDMRMDTYSSSNTCICESHHCPYCRKKAMSNSQEEELPSLISHDVIDVSLPGERWEQLPWASTSCPSATTTKTFQEPLQQSLAFQDIIDNEASENVSHDIPGLRLSSSSFSSMSSLSDVPQRKPSVSTTATAIVAATTGSSSSSIQKNLYEHLQLWRNISLSEEESGASGDSRDIPEQADLPGSARNSASSLSLPNVPQRRSSRYDLQELAYELEQLQDSEESSSSSSLSSSSSAAAAESP